MTHEQSKLVASLLFSRRDVGDLSFEERCLLGIRFDPRDTPACRDDALRILEKLLVAHLERRTEPE